VKGCSNLQALPEDVQIERIGWAVVRAGIVAGVMVDDDAKADRYARKLVERFPVRVISRELWQPDPTVAPIVMLRIGLRGDA
jgi:hypothetical protein